jgi:hypothetical protein
MSRILHRIGWIGLTVVGALMVFAVASDLRSDHSPGLPQDHQGTFTAVAGQSWANFVHASPGAAHYITRLEVGYALHELTFAALFLLIALIPLRRGATWAWWGCWAIMIAEVGYYATFGAQDPSIHARSLIAVIAVPVLLALSAPWIFAADRQRATLQAVSPAS